MKLLTDHRIRLSQRAMERFARFSTKDSQVTRTDQGWNWLLIVLLAGLTGFCASGCRLLENRPKLRKGDQAKVTSSIPNPMIAPMMDRWYLMDQISDELDDYFRIYREDRIRVIDGVMTEGFIETHPQIGGTLLEPWKKDSSPGFELSQSTLQTIRRYAKVRVIPFADNYQIELQIFKELEDLERPVGSPFSGPILRQYHSLGAISTQAPAQLASTGWIPLGRDFQLEQKILANIQSRLRAGIE